LNSACVSPTFGHRKTWRRSGFQYWPVIFFFFTEFNENRSVFMKMLV